MTLPEILIEEGVRAALHEDFGRAGDVTTLATIPAGATASAEIVAREPGVVSGMAFAAASFRLQGAGLEFDPLVADGARVEPGGTAARISGDARALLMGERVALNYLCRLSGIATLTARFAERIAHTRARICCTRKTTPGLRAAEKYAVRCGGGTNHRFGLDDAILIKDNHIAVCGGVAEALVAARAFAGHLLSIEVEVDSLDQFDEALAAGAGVVLLDNFDLEALREAVARADGRAVLEASGGVTLERVAAIAETGVDYVSSSKITIAAPSLDLGLDIRVGD